MPKIKFLLDTNKAKGLPISEKNRKRSWWSKLLTYLFGK